MKIKCTSCNEYYNDGAPACPYCGHSVSVEQNRLSQLRELKSKSQVTAFFLVLIFGAFGVLYANLAWGLMMIGGTLGLMFLVPVSAPLLPLLIIQFFANWLVAYSLVRNHNRLVDLEYGAGEVT